MLKVTAFTMTTVSKTLLYLSIMAVGIIKCGK